MSNKNIMKLKRSNSRKKQIKISNNLSLKWSAWEEISWGTVRAQVIKLRNQIYLAKLQKKEKRLRKLQQKMIGSNANLLYAIRRVTSVNRGKKTAGIDKQIYLTPARRFSLYESLAKIDLFSWNPQPVRRIEISRPGKDPRPLGIPTINDRVIQAIVKNALEPEWEAVFEHGSYGFRPARSSHDAMARLWRILSKKKRRWVLDADIKGCFNNIAHEPLLKKLVQFPAVGLVERWLKAGYFKDQKFFITELGTPQGGIISPLLANIALHGMEQALNVKYHPDGYIRSECPFVPIRYADDFVVLCESEIEAKRAEKILSYWLGERGMQFALEKTHIREVTDGFDFLGWNFRIYKSFKTGSQPWKRSKGKEVTLIHPSLKSINSFKMKVKELWRKYIGKEAKLLIQKLNPILRGWANYHRYVNSNENFRALDHFMYQQAVRYARRKHSSKSWHWVKTRYFKKDETSKIRKTGKITKSKTTWAFTDSGFILYQFKATSLANYSSIAYGKNPDHSADRDYFATRKINSVITKASLQDELTSQQGGLCPICGFGLVEDNWDEPLHVHHKIPRSEGGSNAIGNLVLLHEECHCFSHKKKLTKEVLENKLRSLLSKQTSRKDLSA